MKRLSIYLLAIPMSLLTTGVWAQEVNLVPGVSPVEQDTINKQANGQIGTSPHNNPFNPMMRFETPKNYSPAIHVNVPADGDVPYFKPEIFVKSNKPKISKVDIHYDPTKNLEVLRLNHDIVGYWEGHNLIGLDFNQIAFVNWSAGGDNSISGLLKADLGRKYIKGRLVWDNRLNVRYGVNKQSDRELRKSDDVLDFNSTFGYKSSAVSDWYYVAKLNFKTQLTNGYNYPNTDEPVSRWFAPAYLFVGIGAEYVAPKSGMKFYLSPITYKATFVNDQRLADQGSFGMDKAIVDGFGNIIKHGQRYRAELGFLLSTEWRKEIFKNILFENKLSLYSDYVDRFGNVDVAWEMKLDLKVNNYVRANIGTNLVYDDSIKTNVDVDGQQVMEGPRVQFKQVLGVGLVYTF